MDNNNKSSQKKTVIPLDDEGNSQYQGDSSIPSIDVESKHFDRRKRSKNKVSIQE